jgi:F0F1-type ATP synthase, delta subunit (mitochondrial oligomycin sensitivity protein)
MKKLGKEKTITGIVYSVYSLDEKLLQELEQVLSERFQTLVSLENKIDTSLIQGIKVEIDNFVIDDSIKVKLASLKEELLKRGGFGHAID